MRVALCPTFGGFGLSKVEQEYYDINPSEMFRDDQRLIEVVEDLNDEKQHYIVEVPDDAEEIVLWEYDGMEWLYYKRHGKWHCQDGSSTKGFDPISRKRCKHGVTRIWLRLKEGAEWSRLDFYTHFDHSGQEIEVPYVRIG